MGIGLRYPRPYPRKPYPGVIVDPDGGYPGLDFQVTQKTIAAGTLHRREDSAFRNPSHVQPENRLAPR
jgi:hypothetical protein